MTKIDDRNANARMAWDTNARYWDGQMADGNRFFNALVWPSVERLLRPSTGELLLDVACGNGVASRRLAQAGARVVAIDFSEEMISVARQRGGDRLDYRVVDATDADALCALGPGRFDGALCNMALMDLAEIRPLMNALASLFRSGGRFVFSVLHPCFNSPAVVQTGEIEDREGSLVTTYAVKVSRYSTPYAQVGLAMDRQPVPHPYFHRPLGLLLKDAFDTGFVLDGLEEPTFSSGDVGGTTALSWDGRYSEIPPVLVGRMTRQ